MGVKGVGGPHVRKWVLLPKKVLLLQKSMARSMRDTPAYSILAGNFILWSCVFGTFIVEDTLLGISDKKIIRIFFVLWRSFFRIQTLHLLVGPSGWNPRKTSLSYHPHHHQPFGGDSIWCPSFPLVPENPRQTNWKSQTKW